MKIENWAILWEKTFRFFALKQRKRFRKKLLPPQILINHSEN